MVMMYYSDYYYKQINNINDIIVMKSTIMNWIIISANTVKNLRLNSDNTDLEFSCL